MKKFFYLMIAFLALNSTIKAQTDSIISVDSTATDTTVVTSQDTITLVSTTIPSTILYGTFIDCTITYSSTNIDDSLALKIWSKNAVIDYWYEISGEDKLKITVDTTYIYENKKIVRFRIKQLLGGSIFYISSKEKNIWKFIITSKSNNNEEIRNINIRRAVSGAPTIKNSLIMFSIKTYQTKSIKLSDYFSGNNLNYRIYYHEYSPTSSYFSLKGDTLTMFADEMFPDSYNIIKLSCYALNDSGCAFIQTQIYYVKEINAFLLDINFEAKAVPGQAWESRFAYGDTLQAIDDTIVIEGIPDWATRIDTSYWITNNLKSSNAIDSVYIRKSILKGIAPPKVLKSSAIQQYSIGVQYQGNYFTKKEYYTLTVDQGTGIVTLQHNDNIYPNPTRGNVYLPQNQGIQLFDMSGKLLYQTDISTDHIDLSRYQNGMYFVQINNGTSQTIKKIVKE